TRTSAIKRVVGRGGRQTKSLLKHILTGESLMVSFPGQLEPLTWELSFAGGVLETAELYCAHPRTGHVNAAVVVRQDSSSRQELSIFVTSIAQLAAARFSHDQFCVESDRTAGAVRILQTLEQQSGTCCAQLARRLGNNR
ncbi:MAG: hypothetical protein QOJ42_1836, partial [Acidobacteriaceae bacterium]|nr:hypothetical protein [Acidobacteriaceae bacterium]